MLKWILSQLDDTVILNLAAATNTKVKGFREITKSNLKLVKPQIMNELQKPTKTVRLKSGLLRYVTEKLEEDDIKSLREKNEQELREAIENDTYSLLDVCIALITGDEEEQRPELAEQLFTSLYEEENSAEQPEEPENTDAKDEQLAAIEAEYTKKLEKLEEQLVKEKEKNRIHQDTIDELRAKRKAESQEWRKERNEYADQINVLTSKLEQKQAELEKQLEENSRLTDEGNIFKQQIKELTDKLENSKPVLISTLMQNKPTS